MMLKSVLPAAVAALSLIAPAMAQTFTAQQAQEDLSALYEGLSQAHFDLFATTPKTLFDTRYAELMERLDREMTAEELHFEFQRFAALARHGHVRVEGFNPGFVTHVEAGGPVFPLDFRIRDGAVIIVGAPPGSGVEIGDEIRAINGEPNALWLAKVSRNISAETPDLAYSILERTSPYAMWLAYGNTAQYTLSVGGPGGQRDVLIDALDYATYADQPVSSGGPDLTGREARMITDEIAYLRPGGFYNLDATTPEEYFDVAATRRYVEFIDLAFEDFITSGAQALIVDLRDNAGGDNSYSDPVLAWFSDEPFRFYSEFRMRVSPQTTASNAARLQGREPSEYGISGVYAELFAEASDGEIVLFELDYVEPHERRFKGKVYALINRASYSNAVSVGTIIQDYGMGLVVGEATTDMATMYGSMEHFYLPHSRLQIGYPKAHIIRPNGEERLHTLTPDIEISAPLFADDRDVMLERLVDMIEGETQSK